MFNEKREHNRYSLRKLSIGLASILLGISFVSVTGNNVKADTVNSGKNGDQTIVKGSNTAIKIDSKASEAVTKSQAAAEKTAKGNAPEAVAKPTAESTLKSANSIAKQQNTAVKDAAEAAKQGLDTAAVAHSNSNETTLNVKSGKAIAQNMLKDGKKNQAGADPVKNKLKTADLMTATGKKLNAQMLSASKIMSPANDTSLPVLNTNDAYALDSKNGLHEHANVNDNGGYDADFWGKINVDDWYYTINGDRIEIHGLKYGVSTGANDAVIVPNLDDFKLAGKDGGAKTVYINNSALGETAKHKYYGLSKTNGNTFTINRYLYYVFSNDGNLTYADLNSLDTSNVTNMNDMFNGAYSLTNLDVSKWDTSKVTDMNYMFAYNNSLTSLDVSKWNTSKVTDMSWMFADASSLTNLDVSKWDTGKVTDMSGMFYDNPKLALIANSGKFADYLVNHDSFAKSRIDSDVKSVTTDNAKLLKLLTSDAQQDSSTRTITFTFPANYSPDLTKYHLTKVNNIYQIKQSIDYAKSYLQGTVLINATDDITKHHIDTTKPNEISSTWQPNYDKLVLAHKNADGTVSFDKVHVPKIPGYKTEIKHNTSKATKVINRKAMPFIVSYIAIPTKPAIVPDKPAVTPDKPTVKLNKPDVMPSRSDIQDYTSDRDIQTPIAVTGNTDTSQNVDPVDFGWKITAKIGFDNNKRQTATYKVTSRNYSLNLPYVENRKLHLVKQYTTKDAVSFAYMRQNTKTVDLSNNAVAIAPKEATWHVANEPDQNTYRVSNGKYTVELPHISNAQLLVIAKNSTKNSLLFTYKRQNTKYVFKIKFVNGHYLLTTYKIKSDKLVKLINYSFIKSSKMIDIILDWLKLK